MFQQGAWQRFYVLCHSARLFHRAVTVHNFSGELVLLDAEQWRNECEHIAAQFPQPSLRDLLMPYFCLWLAGATSEE
ncbi:hypothetical protein V5799_013040 [Amblyomma americanum]|uniref:Uncharacterized protein n=1 Tax=Amblyomma americanum TaxID=6943 RepID=A0AAQ4E729_AMBAM